MKLKTALSITALFIMLATILNAQLVDWTATITQSGSGIPAFGKAIAYDASGNVFVAGKGNVLDQVSGNFIQSLSVSKFSPAGMLLATNSISNIQVNTSYPVKLVIDNTGSVYVAGSFFVNATSGYDIELAKFNNSLTSIIYSKIIAASPAFGVSNDFMGDMMVDASNNLYVGYNFSNYTPHGAECFIRKFNSTGTVLWTFDYTTTGTANEQINGIALNGTTAVYATGWASSTASANQVLTFKVDAAGTLVWSKLHDGDATMSLNDYGKAILVSGTSVYTLAMETFNSPMATDVVLLKMKDISGTVQSAIRSTFSGNNVPASIGTDPSGNVYMTGTGNNNLTAFYREYNVSGTLLTSASSGPITGSTLRVTAAVVTSDGDVYMCGEATNTNAFFTLGFGTGGGLIWFDVKSTSSCGNCNQYLGGAIAAFGNGTKIASVNDYTFIGSSDNWQIRQYPNTLRLAGNENEMSEKLQVYPNPAHDLVTVTGINEKATVFLTDMEGRQLKQETIISGQQIYVGDLPAGNYFLKIISSDKTAVQKLVLQ